MHYFDIYILARTQHFLHITKTRLCNFDPLKPHFNIAKLGFTGVYVIFLISAQKYRLWVLSEYISEKYQNFYLKISIFLVVNFSVYLNRRVFVMVFACAPNEDSSQPAHSPKQVRGFCVRFKTLSVVGFTKSSLRRR